MSAVPAAFDRRGDDVKFNALSQRMDDLAESHKTIQFAVDQNTAITKRVDENTAGLVEAWTAIAGGLKVLGYLGTVAKWVAGIAGAIAAVYGAYWAATTGTPPPTITPLP